MAAPRKRETGHPPARAGGPADVVAFPQGAPRSTVALPLRRRLAYLAVPFVLFFGLLAGFEVAVRASLRRVSTLEVFVQAPEQHRGFRDVRGASVFEGDPLLFWRVAPNLRNVTWDFTRVSTNGQGLRYPRTVGPKPPHTFRVACFGDSVTFGYRVPTVWPERPDVFDAKQRPFPPLLESALRAANPGREIEVVPFAVPGYTSHQGLAWLRRDIGGARPDVVVLSYGWNDVNRRVRTDRETMSTGPFPVLLRRLVGGSQALLHASARWQPRSAAIAAGRDPVTRVLPAEYVENLRAMVQLSRAQGAKVLVIAPIFRDPKTEPTEAQRMARHRDALRQAMLADSTAYLEIVELTETGWPANDRFFGERIHPSWVGHRLLANRLAETMQAQQMLGDLKPPVPHPLS